MYAWPHETIRERDPVLVDKRPRARFVVIAIHEQKAWVQEIDSGRNEIVALSACQRLTTLH